MKEYREINKEELLHIMVEFEQVFDIVRLVEPEETAVVRFEDGELKKTQLEPCFSVWEKNQRCDNCISLRACLEKKRMTKFEFRNEEIYSVIAMPFLVKDKEKVYSFSLELVNHVSDDMVLQTYGTGTITDEVKKINSRLYEDSLTRVFNRRYYDEKLYIYEMTHSLPQKIGFLIIDVNKFKYVNDHFGHAQGDDLLVKVAEVLKKHTRDTDKVMRFGGDEFLVVLRDCSRIFVEKKIIQLKKAVSGISLEWMGEYHPSIAVGMAYTEQFDGNQEQIQALCEIADERMYQNKKILMEEKNLLMSDTDKSDQQNNLLIVGLTQRKEEGWENISLNGIQVYEAADKEAAIQSLKENPIEIVLINSELPDGSGFDLVRTIRNGGEYENVIIFMAIERSEELEVRALEAGADDFVSKPLKEELLIHRIKGWLFQSITQTRLDSD